MVKKLRVAVVMGGDSAEREISLLSGQAVLGALDPGKYEARPVEVGRLTGEPASLPEILQNGGVDLAFIALHGGAGEGGALQSALEEVGLPYTGSGPKSSAQALDKIVAQRIFQEAGLLIPRNKGFLGLTPEKLPAACAEARKSPGLPLVVKPSREGSTIGITIVRDEKDLLPAMELARRCGPDLLAEEFIPGIEITAGVLGRSSPRVLPLVEIVPKSGFYDYHAKYIASDTEKIVPARVPEETAETARGAAATAYRALGCKGFARVDMIVRGREVFVLEANTIPGLTSHSLVPRAAEAAGISFSALLDEIIESALEEDSHEK